MRWLFKIHVPLILFAFFATTAGFAQYQNLGTVKQAEHKVSPWFVGGMLGGSFSNNGGSFEVSPLVGYKVTSDFHVGSRLTYIYSSYNFGGTTGRHSFHDYGGSLFARHLFLNFLFAHVEYEVLSVEYMIDQYTNDRRTINSLFIGGGLYQTMGGRGFATIAILYNLLETQYSPYSNPVIRIGFGVGL
ncbi:MAG: hypothetical protein H8E34_05800 [Bacteroidetes bacterium]|nr:hypothetical protein [Bacteroidota bacterium]MBL6943863.1 hypothetical protein [Bacteroidales bacterium]